MDLRTHAAARERIELVLDSGVVREDWFRKLLSTLLLDPEEPGLEQRQYLGYLDDLGL